MLKSKRKLLVSACFILAIVLMIGLLLVWHYWIRSLLVNDFTLADYARRIEDSPSDEVVGVVSNASEARKKAIAVLIDVYGEDVIAGEKPFTVSYDNNANAWLVSGSMPPIPFMLGGTAHIIINGADGDVLAVWHAK